MTEKTHRCRQVRMDPKTYDWGLTIQKHFDPGKELGIIYFVYLRRKMFNTRDPTFAVHCDKYDQQPPSITHGQTGIYGP